MFDQSLCCKASLTNTNICDRLRSLVLHGSLGAALGISRSKALPIIQQLSQVLAHKAYVTVRAKPEGTNVLSLLGQHSAERHRLT